jgi:hypothetical protein
MRLLNKQLSIRKEYFTYFCFIFWIKVQFLTLCEHSKTESLEELCMSSGKLIESQAVISSVFGFPAA